MVDAHVRTANFLSQLLNIRDSRDLSLANFSIDELRDRICFVRTSYSIVTIYCAYSVFLVKLSGDFLLQLLTLCTIFTMK